MDNNNQRLFVQAVSYIKKKQYQRALPLMEALYKTFYFEESIVLYYGFIFSQLEDYETALKYFNKLRNSSIDNNKINLLQAYCYAKMGYVEKALEIWLSISKKSDAYLIVKKILVQLKKARDKNTFSKFLQFSLAYGDLPDLGNFKKKVKSNSPFTTDYKAFAIIIGVILLSVLIVYIISLTPLNFIQFKETSFLQKSKGVDDIDKETIVTPVNTSNNLIYTYADSKEIKSDLKKIKSLLSQKKYNEPMMLINKIKNSNASLTEKTKAETMTELLVDPLYNNLDIKPNYLEILQNPLLYKNTFIQWKGIVNKIIDEFTFKIMIYSKNPIYIDGLAVCNLPKGFPLFEKQKIEIFGKFLSKNTGDNSLEITIYNIIVLNE